MAKFKAKYHKASETYEPVRCSQVAISAKYDKPDGGKGDNITGEVICGFPLTIQAAHESNLIFTYPECPACALYPEILNTIIASLPDQYENAASASSELARINQVMLMTHQDMNAWIYNHYSPKEAVDYVSDTLLWKLIVVAAGQVGLFDQTGGTA